jgi:tRNA (guanine-N7-)-methyltransferase
VVQPELVEALAKHTQGNCDVFLQSDVEEVAREMRERFRAHPAFVDSLEDLDAWIDVNPTGVPTEREVATHAKRLPVYRALVKRHGGAGSAEMQGGGGTGLA